MAELDRAEIAARIGQARTEAGLTQPELSELVEPPVHWRTVQTWESVKDPRVPWDRIDQIARITKRSKFWILHGEEEAEPGLRASIDELSTKVDALDRKLDVANLDQRLMAIERELSRLVRASSTV